ncbi:MAG: peptidoglycan recognition protein family protein [Treponema sp.]|jgi:hypothetical protein|nr:peptidoglycan recognition protein family protein [Treponema sp.]
MIITKQFLSLGKKARGLNGLKVLFTRPVDTIIIHWLGPYPGQSVYSPWYWWEDGTDGTGIQASTHFVVKGGDVLQALPLNEVGWHSGDTRHYHSIGIETIPMNTDGVFAQDTIETLKELVAHIRETYPRARLERHYDGTQKKDCPKWYTPLAKDGKEGNERWIALRNYLDDVGVA